MQDDGDSARELAEGGVGEIWIDSPSKALGYWDRPQQSDQDFRARLGRRGDTTEDPESGSGSGSGSGSYLRTGDLGFLYRGELFICGRIKDLIIVRGSNHYPQDLERSAERDQESTLRAGCSAAFSIPLPLSHTEGVVLMAECKDNVAPSKYAAMAESIRLCISKDHGLGLSSVLIMSPRSILKTTSGKITRAGNKRSFLAGTLKPLYRWDGQVAPNDVNPNPNPTALDVAQMSPPTWIDRGTDLLPAAGPSQPLMDFPSFTSAEVRAMPLPELAACIERLLVHVSATGPSRLSEPVDRDAALVVMGLDSMTVVQFKGAVEAIFHCDVPDEFMFTRLATVSAFAVAAKHGHLTDEQSAELAAGMAPGAGTTTIQLKDEPCCPWFIGHRFLCFC